MNDIANADPSALLGSAAAHAVRRVPVAAPGTRAGPFRASLAQGAYDCASHVVVCAGEHFLGVLRIEQLLSAGDDVAVESLMDADAPVVAPGVDQEVAAWRATQRGESALAVVDAERRFVGLIPPHRLLAVLLAEHEEDLSRLGGFTRGAARVRSSSEESVRRRFRHRVPWLLVGLGGALQAAEFVSRFESELRTHIALAFFIPAIVYLADAVGTQTETVVVRALSVGVPIRTMAARELATGLVIGAALGLLAGLFVLASWQQPQLAACIGLSVFATCGTATLTGLSLPWCLDALAIDPAFGSGPLATMIQDLLSILIYFAIAAVVF